MVGQVHRTEKEIAPPPFRLLFDVWDAKVFQLQLIRISSNPTLKSEGVPVAKDVDYEGGHFVSPKFEWRAISCSTDPN